jgi:AcrR family transcriptional regulator
MGRWEPGAEGRFRAAAMELFVEHGYEQTTVADIAERAGLTARTFFRYFDDKREVLFHGSERLQQTMVSALKGAPANATAVEAISAALDATGEFFEGNRDFARQRSSVIASNAELRERELIKLATLSGALADALLSRGITQPDASLAAEAGIAVFRVAFGLWVGESEQRSFSEIVSESLARLRALTAIK